MNRQTTIALLAVAASFAFDPASAPAVPPASDFSARVDNPWFPLEPGTRYVSVGAKDGEPARDVMTVTHKTHTIDGAPCVVVDDRLYLRAGSPSARPTGIRRTAPGTSGTSARTLPSSTGTAA